ncbi:DUF3800 domain-containing protein [Paenibacillus taichungensis]|uniref:DUF3800 domain-containing protein n=1 Tax=Paenibacillus taichungensis TaxID=484184 RepID=UPI0038D1F387
MQQYIIYTDESEKKGRFFGNFYGGVLVRSQDFDHIKKSLDQKKEELNIKGEVKWQKVTENYLQKYLELMSLFFDYVAEDKIKVRIMFTHNIKQAIGLTKEQREQEYFLLYYQFFKHIFGFQHSIPTHTMPNPTSLYVLFDQLPDTKEKNERFKNYIYRLQEQDEFKAANLIFQSMNDIGEATSHEHILLQCLDVTLGAMEFRLNEKHKDKPEGQRTRGKRTRAKEKLYKYINSRIRDIYPGFNIGSTTGIEIISDRWNHPYRHWCFQPKNNQLNKNYVSKGKRKGAPSRLHE